MLILGKFVAVVIEVCFYSSVSVMIEGICWLISIECASIMFINNTSNTICLDIILLFGYIVWSNSFTN